MTSPLGTAGLSITSQPVYVLGASAVAVSAPADTSEDILATINVPAGAMGLSGQVRLRGLVTVNSNANAKTVQVRLGGIAGTVYLSKNAASVTTYPFEIMLANRGVANSQTSYQDVTGLAFNSLSGNAKVTSAIDTTVAQTIVITGQKAVAGDTITLESYLVELIIP